MDDKRPLVSAIVLNYRSPQDALKCVAALLKQTIADRMEIFVVDNHSDDESIAAFRARFRNKPQVTILESHRNVGFGQGNTLAAARAQGKYLLFINPDNVLPPDTIERMAAMLSEHPQAGILGPALVYPDGSVRPSARPAPTFSDLLRKRLRPRAWHEQYRRSAHFTTKNSDARLSDLDSRVYPVDWLVGTCLMIRRELFQHLGGFDPRFFLFFEDIDLCRRCREAGFNVLYAPGIQVLDKKERLSDGNALQFLFKKAGRIHVVSAIKYFWKWRRRVKN